MIVRPHKTTHSVTTLLFALKGSIVPIIWPRVVYTMLLSLAVVVAERRGITVAFTLNAAPLTLLGLTLAIFLQFRNSVAYQRWWEGRTLWGELVICARNLVRQTSAFLPDLDPRERRALVYRVIGFVHALRHHLRGTPAQAELERWLGHEASERLKHIRHLPNAILDELGRDLAKAVRDADGDAILLARMDEELDRFSHVLGGCERIKGTPIPFTYILLLHRTVHVYCFMLPFCLIGPLGWFTPLVVGVIAYTFFGLDAIGEQIEDPFDLLPNDLPLDAISRNIEIDLLGLLGDTDLPPPLEPKDFVLL
ncbi:bestrophin family protein [Dyella jiangningensis]|uniref:bestrophin family protein n=1 Tax=Dyella jiangningensis TaxID=1379159 RepID=UPI00240F5421|nr:bestrophin family protein [Dyella jiangningensis]MDG2538699.1 bestrophin family protein [Dyella jiangningensis]